MILKQDLHDKYIRQLKAYARSTNIPKDIIDTILQESIEDNMIDGGNKSIMDYAKEKINKASIPYRKEIRLNEEITSDQTYLFEPDTRDYGKLILMCISDEWITCNLTVKQKEIIESIRSGKTQVEIAKERGITQGCISLTLKNILKNWVKYREGTSSPYKTKVSISKITYKELSDRDKLIYNMYISGVKQSEISKKLNISYTTVCCLIYNLRHGYNTRRKYERKPRGRSYEEIKAACYEANKIWRLKRAADKRKLEE